MADIAKLNIINSSRIMKKIWQEPGISRIEIAEHLNLDRSTITKIMNTLTQKGWVVTVPKDNARESVGRKPVGLAINTDIGVILGIEVKTQNCRAVVTDLCGKILLSETFPFEPAQETIVELITRVFAAVDRIIKRRGIRILMTGIGLSGLIDPFNGIVKLSNPLEIYEPVSLADKLESMLGIPVLIENDANCCCWGELVYRKESLYENFLSVLGEFRSTDLHGLREPGIAVGLGIVIHGEVFYGDTFSAGEFRSVDCLPDRITQFSISNERSHNIRENPAALSEVFTELARNLALVINIFDFRRVIITGEFTEFSEELANAIQTAVSSNWVYSNLENKRISINFPSLGDTAVAFGAASNAIGRIFSVPQVGNEKFQRGTILLDTLTGSDIDIKSVKGTSKNFI